MTVKREDIQSARLDMTVASFTKPSFLHKRSDTGCQWPETNGRCLADGDP